MDTTWIPELGLYLPNDSIPDMPYLNNFNSFSMDNYYFQQQLQSFQVPGAAAGAAASTPGASPGASGSADISQTDLAMFENLFGQGQNSGF